MQAEMSKAPLITPVMLSPKMTDTITQTTIYINEKGGSNDHGTKGTKEDPFATLFAAYLSFPLNRTPLHLFSTPALMPQSQSLAFLNGRKLQSLR